MAENFNLTEIQGDLFSAPPAYSLAHCISADCRLGLGIAKIFRQKFGRIDELQKMDTGVGGVSPLSIGPFGGKFVYNLVTKGKYFEKPTYQSLRSSLEAMRAHAAANNVKEIAMPKIGCGLDKLEWSKVEKIIKEVFGDTDMQIRVYYL